MSQSFDLLPGLSVAVDEVFYDPSQPAQPDRPHPFVYHISIHNHSDETVNIFGRKWILRDTDGKTQIVEGDGVVGQRPCLKPGESFSYNSYHVIDCASRASGAFYGTTLSGRPVYARIPDFEMHPPQVGE
jgi:ApaG protein